jgi:hypothetical protein
MKRICGHILCAAVLLFLFSCAARKETVPPAAPPPAVPPPPPVSAVPPPSPKVEVARIQMTADREYIGVKLRITGSGRVDLDNMDIYMIDEATGEKFTVVRLQRIGRLAEFSVPGEAGIRHVMFRNREGKLKTGKRVTVVIGQTRLERLVIQP